MVTNDRQENKRRRWILRLVFFGGLIVAWEVVARAGFWPEYLFPPPSRVLAAIAHGFGDQSYPIGIRDSLWRLVQGYAIALVVGLTIGMAMAEVRWIKDTVGLLVMGLQALPSICWLPLALLWFGLNERAILFVVVMGAVMSIAQSTEDGVRAIRRRSTSRPRAISARRARAFTPR